jgi:hypothetical protein
MAAFPLIVPYSEMVALGYEVNPTHSSPKPPHVRAMFSGLQVQSPFLQNPPVLSLEHAMYGFDEKYEMPVLDFFDIPWIHW